MDDSVEQARCCSRPMSVIGVHQRASALQLFSCPSCGRHAWHRDGREIDRDQVLESLRVEREPAAVRRPAGAAATRVPSVAPAPAVCDEPSRREELQRMLAGFSTHGSTP